MASEAQKAIVNRFFQEAVNRRNYDVVDELVAVDFVLYSALLGEVHGGAAYKESVLGLLSACPDLHATVEDLIGAEDETVVSRLTYRGTDRGGFVKGHAATGKPFEFGAICIWRVAHNTLAEVWQEADRLRLRHQLRLLPV